MCLSDKNRGLGSLANDAAASGLDGTNDSSVSNGRAEDEFVALAGAELDLRHSADEWALDEHHERKYQLRKKFS